MPYGIGCIGICIPYPILGYCLLHYIFYSPCVSDILSAKNLTMTGLAWRMGYCSCGLD
jgi:hypothetical protein